ncbi:MAG TPA: Hint domain-containing protein [Acetobacteraceae bacterium]|nr:Hint domain-containing protein [Acetobacteraceae bacterium]
MSTRFTASGAPNSAWSYKTTWIPSGYPGQLSPDDVALIAGAGPVLVRYNLLSDTIAALEIDDPAGTLVSVGGHRTLTVTGTLELAAGTIRTGFGWLINAGSIETAPGSTVVLSNKATLEGTGGVDVGGLLKSTYATNDIYGPLGGTGEIEASGGTVVVENNIVAPGLTLAVDSRPNSGLVLAGTIEASATLDFLNSTRIGGNVVIADAASFDQNVVVDGMTAGSFPNGANVLRFTDPTVIAADLESTGTIVNGDTVEFRSVHDPAGAPVVEFVLGSPVSAGVIAKAYDGARATSIYLVCYAAGTRLAAAAGAVAVEDLRPGDLVAVLEEGAVVQRPVRWVGRRRIDLAAHPEPRLVLPIRIRAGAFADGMPQRDLLVSPDHAIYVDGALIAARQLVNGTSIVQEQGLASVEYFHVELDRHAILLAEGLPAESYLDTGNRGFFANAEAPLVLHPDLTEDRAERSRAAGACAPFLTDEASVRPVWERLAARAGALGLSVASTGDPDLHLLAKGRRVRALFAENGLYIFALPSGATGARLVSRAAAPSDLRPWLDDRRRLGVAVRRLVLRTVEAAIELPLMADGMGAGWWEPEGAGEAAYRWTDGSALLILPPYQGQAMLEVHLQATAAYPLIAADAPADMAARRA